MFRAVLGFSVVALLASPAMALPSEFSVQGVLRDNTGALQSSMVNVTITLWDAQTAGNQLAGPFGPTAVAASNGLFTLTITDANLDTELSSASAVWLEMIVGNDSYPRQLVTPELFAIHASHADDSANLGGKPASAYLTSATASSTYATQSSLASYLTTAAAASTYVPQSTLASYLTTADAASTYATQSSLASYLTTATASSTYATQSSLASYLTTSAASSTYETQSAAASTYETQSAAASAFQPKGSYVDLTSAQTLSGTKEFTGSFDPGALPQNTVAIGVLKSANNFGGVGICGGGYFGGGAACMGSGQVGGVGGWFWGYAASSTTTTKTMSLDSVGNLVTSGTVSQASSAAFKKDIRFLDLDALKGALKMVLDTPVATYRYKTASDESKVNYGVIAELTPKPLLAQDDKAVNLSNTVGVLLASIKAQQAHIGELEARLAKLEKQRRSPSRAVPAPAAAPVQ